MQKSSTFSNPDDNSCHADHQQQSAQKGHENCPKGIYGHLAETDPSFWATFQLTGRVGPRKVEHAQLNAKEQSGQKTTQEIAIFVHVGSCGR